MLSIENNRDSKEQDGNGTSQLNDESNTKSTPKKRCDYCKDWFKPERPWMRFCSEKCRNGWHNDARAVEREKRRKKHNHIK